MKYHYKEIVIPENMLEAILFGYEKGSFTGASTTTKGIFRAAIGTLLQVEILEMPISLEKLLFFHKKNLSRQLALKMMGIPVDVESQSQQQEYG